MELAILALILGFWEAVRYAMLHSLKKEVLTRIVRIEKHVGLPCLAALLGLLPAAPAWGAWGSVGSLFTGNSKTSQSAWTVNFSAQCDAGNVCVCAIATDNDGDGLDDDINLITDAVGNTWVEGEENEFDPGGGNAGASVSIQYTVASSNITTTTNVTVNLAAAVTAKGMTCWEFSITSGNVVSVVCTFEDGTTGSGGTDSCTASSGNREHLAIQANAVEDPDNTCTALASSTCFTVSSSSTSGGGSASNMGAKASFKIQTSATPEAGLLWSPSVDFAEAMAALDEDTPAAVVPVRRRAVVIE